jgi:hypothetical protein
MSEFSASRLDSLDRLYADAVDMPEDTLSEIEHKRKVFGEIAGDLLSGRGIATRCRVQDERLEALSADLKEKRSLQETI